MSTPNPLRSTLREDRPFEAWLAEHVSLTRERCVLHANTIAFETEAERDRLRALREATLHGKLRGGLVVLAVPGGIHQDRVRLNEKYNLPYTPDMAAVYLEASVITRIYVDNFRTLVNFEWKPGKVALLLGENGAGKTSVLDVLWALRRLVIDEADVAEVFPEPTRTRWGTPRADQVFELDVQSEESVLRYRLVVRHEPRKGPAIFEEIFKQDAKPISDFRQGKLQFETASGQPLTLKRRPDRSALSVVIGATYEGPAQVFSDVLLQTWIVAPNPRAMSGSAETEATFLARDCSNFAAWMRNALVASPESVSRSRTALQDIIGLKTLQVPKGTTRLMAGFDIPDAKQGLDFEELSDGQRQLIVLYVLRYVVCETALLVAFDEPDNYISLREIQPWMSEVLELAQSREGPQVWFVSHHPEMLNQLAPNDGTRFFREGMATRIEPFRGVPGLVAAEVVARGWDGDD